MRNAVGGPIWVGVVVLAILTVGCGNDKATTLRANTCAEQSFAELALPDGFASPTGKGFFFKCDLNEAMTLATALPIEVYSEDRRADVIGWWYPAKCAYPEGLVSVGESTPTDCATSATDGPAPQS